MIYVVETFQLSDEARADPSFGEWLQTFNSLVLGKNPAVRSISVYASYTGAFELEIWFGMEDFSALDRSAEAEKAMFQDPEVMKEFDKFTTCMKPIGRRIMLPINRSRES
jgi:hypothetical protein